MLNLKKDNMLAEVKGSALDRIDDLFKTVTASLKPEITIRLVGRKKLFMKVYEVQLSGYDAGSCLPNGQPRKFSVTYEIESLYDIQRLQETLSNKNAIGVTDLGNPDGIMYLKVDTGNERFVVKRTLVTRRAYRYAMLENRIDLGHLPFKNTHLVEFNKPMIRECVS